MSIYSQIAWFPLCGGLTALGLVLSWLTARRRGAAAGLRGAAWSLLPLAAYLTGAIKMLWQMGVAIGSFAVSFVWNPLVWSGLIVLALAVVLFVVSGSLRARRASKSGGPDRSVKAGRQPGQALEPGRSSQPAAKARAATPGDEDFADVADILRKHGIR
ncbi:MAG: cellulose synthase [Actinobacteria bacterium]|nr:cellulose synthase [Actinomycetota bacterium]